MFAGERTTRAPRTATWPPGLVTVAAAITRAPGDSVDGVEVDDAGTSMTVVVVVVVVTTVVVTTVLVLVVLVLVVLVVVVLEVGSAIVVVVVALDAHASSGDRSTGAARGNDCPAAAGTACAVARTFGVVRSSICP